MIPVHVLKELGVRLKWQPGDWCENCVVCVWADLGGWELKHATTPSVKIFYMNKLNAVNRHLLNCKGREGNNSLSKTNMLWFSIGAKFWRCPVSVLEEVVEMMSLLSHFSHLRDLYITGATRTSSRFVLEAAGRSGQEQHPPVITWLYGTLEEPRPWLSQFLWSHGRFLGTECSSVALHEER